MHLKRRAGQITKNSSAELRMPNKWEHEHARRGIMSKAEIEQREQMNEEAESQVTARVAFLNRLPDTINDILEDIDENGR